MEAKMKDINIQSKIALQSMNRLLVQYLELANKIPEEDWKKIVLASQKQSQSIKGVTDNIQRGNLFMVLFFVRELIETLLNSEN
jgi:hypothetical protein